MIKQNRLHISSPEKKVEPLKILATETICCKCLWNKYEGKQYTKITYVAYL